MSSNGSSASNKVDFAKPIDRAVLKGKTALVTGGASGIGAAIVQALASSGVFVLIADVNERDGQKLASSLTGQGFNVIFHRTDVTSFESQVAAFKSCLEKSPNSTIDLVIPCAGLGSFYMDKVSFDDQFPVGSDPVEPPLKVINVNLLGVYYTMHLACHYFKNSESDKASDKHLLFISSLAGYLQVSFMTDYSTAKFGVRGMWKSIRSSAFNFHPGMRTNLVAPSYIETPMTKDELEGAVAMGIPIGDVQDAVQGVLRLCCDSEIAGRAICIAPRRSSSDDFGSSNFDLEDNILSGDGNEALLAALGKGLFGSGVADQRDVLEGPRSIQ